MRITYHQAAEAEAEAAAQWYAQRDLSAAEGFIAELRNGEKAITEAPERWAPSARGTRRYLMDRYPFAIVYRRDGELIQIIAVAHLRRRPRYWTNRTT
ncbi:MAG: hypothetical protein AMXMBFR81_31070 [Chthonomonas sp.]|nr:type II toxin-antitoxin system RelE/ParE family toxin [Fimbriimonadaceae bacterium]